MLANGTSSLYLIVSFLPHVTGRRLPTFMVPHISIQKALSPYDDNTTPTSYRVSTLLFSLELFYFNNNANMFIHCRFVLDYLDLSNLFWESNSPRLIQTLFSFH